MKRREKTVAARLQKKGESSFVSVPVGNDAEYMALRDASASSPVRCSFTPSCGLSRADGCWVQGFRITRKETTEGKAKGTSLTSANRLGKYITARGTAQTR